MSDRTEPGFDLAAIDLTSESQIFTGYAELRPPLITERNPIRGGWAVLTPQLFRQIDDAARTLAGKVFALRKHTDMKGLWGEYCFMAIGHVRNGKWFTRDDTIGLPYFSERSALYIANQVWLGEINGGFRPELDLNKIPRDRFFEYVGWHEIGHVIHNFHMWDPVRPIRHPDLRKINEVLADRYAWRQMFPGVPMPIRPGHESVSTWADERIADLLAAGDRLSRDVKPLKPGCSTWINEYNLKGFPWSQRARPEIAARPQWLAEFEKVRRDYANWRTRCFRVDAREMAELLLRAAKHPTKRAQRLVRSGRIHELAWRTSADIDAQNERIDALRVQVEAEEDQ